MKALGLVPEDLEGNEDTIAELAEIFDSPLREQHVRVIAALFGKEVPPTPDACSGAGGVERSLIALVLGGCSGVSSFLMDWNPQVLSWNVRGLNNPAKRNAVREFVVDAKVNLVCLEETKIDVFDPYLVMQCIGPSFDGFAYLPALDTRGGILLGWSSAHLSISNITFDRNFLSGLVHSQDGLEWWLSAVYGPQGDELKTQFLVELQHRRDVSPGPWMVLGDFNMIIRANEKSNSNLNRGMMRKFKAFVDNNELKELYMHGRRFTWSNERDQLVMTKIDRVLVSVDWELNFPDVLLQALSSNISDHAPLHLSTSALFCPKRRFRFEICWTRLEGFEQAVKDAWVCEDDTVDPFKRLNALLRNTASALQAWGQRKIGNIKIHMAIANFVILRLERAMESRQLDWRERWLRRSLKHTLLGLASLQRTIERQRSRLRWIREGDANTKLFQAVANGRRTKNFIPHIRHNGELVSQ
ncbi:uncharacterized protein [Aegilops tauschii subsp. strangulata]|uniref:uncharacterized protein n=1 Tax=Aegilops tauschii subsp. strangulata TaxID=200361 RepID=UPI003CC85151